MDPTQGPSPLPTARIIEGGAKASIKSSGAGKSAGKKMTRLAIGDDPRFFLAAKIITKDSGIGDRFKAYFFKDRYVEVKGTLVGRGPGEKVILNINSIAKRCHLTKEQIINAANKGDDSLLNLIGVAASKTGSVIDQYSKIVRNFKTTGLFSKELVFKHDKMAPEKTPLQPSTILKTIRAAMATPLRPMNLVGQSESKFFAVYDQNKNDFKLKFLHKELGKGSFGQVHQLMDVGTGKIEGALKLAIRGSASFSERARQDVLNEYRILSELNSPWGIQVAPHQLVDIKGKTGFLIKQYDMDFENYSMAAAGGKLFEGHLPDFQQILSGLKFFADQNILHGDLKGGNILVKKRNDGFREVHIADMGGARKPNDPDFRLEDASMAHTGAFSFKEDLEKTMMLQDTTRGLRAQVLAARKDLEKLKPEDSQRTTLEDLIKSGEEKLEEYKNTYITIEKKRDVFSTGVIFYRALTKTYPFPFTSPRPYQDASKPYRNVRGIPDEMNTLLKGMLDPDNKKRLSAEEANEQFTAILAKYPETETLIKKAMNQRK